MMAFADSTLTVQTKLTNRIFVCFSLWASLNKVTKENVLCHHSFYWGVIYQGEERFCTLSREFVCKQDAAAAPAHVYRALINNARNKTSSLKVNMRTFVGWTKTKKNILTVN